MVHKPKHKVHSFRGLLTDTDPDNQIEINLERQNVNLAYRLVKFQVMTAAPAGSATEHVVKIYRESQSSVTGTVDFSDVDLLGVNVWTNAVGYGFEGTMGVIFDNVLFSRNIYVTQSEETGSASCNYYIELEEVPVGAATLMQLKLGVARKLNLQQD